jgi:hypothetical protein
MILYTENRVKESQIDIGTGVIYDKNTLVSPGDGCPVLLEKDQVF